MGQNKRLYKSLLKAGMVAVLPLFIFAGCEEEPVCKKCIEDKPAATAFSTKLNGINHVITTDQAHTMATRYQANIDSLRNGQLAAVNGMLPHHETFNLKAIDTLLCQPNTVGLRVYLAMDANRQMRFVLVGVDPQGHDVISRRIDRLPDVATGELAIDAGQRWP